MFWRYKEIERELDSLRAEISITKRMIKEATEMTLKRDSLPLISYFSGQPYTRPVDALDMKIVYSPPTSDKISIVPKEKEQK